MTDTAVEYYVAINGETFGPASKDTLSDWIKAGSFHPTDFVWKEETQEWVQASTVPELSPLFILPPPPTSGLSSPDELPSGFVSDAEATASETFCSLHEDEAAAGVCPQCSRPFCSECLGELEGMRMCLDCIGREKEQAVRSVRPSRAYAFILAGAGVLIVGALMGLLFTGPTPPDQLDPPPRIAIEHHPLPSVNKTAVADTE